VIRCPGHFLCISNAMPRSVRRPLLCLAAAVLLIPAIGCGKKKTAYTPPPPPPPTTAPAPAPAPAPSTTTKGAKPSAGSQSIHLDPNAKVIWTQEGWASWYGPYYNHRKAANGEVYEQNEMTAAHNTLPLNSIVRVVNLKTKQVALVRITDRGPFVSDRIIDLSVASAKALGVYLPGTAPVRLEVLSAPRPIEIGGRWCIQIGAMQTQDAAIKLKQHLLHRYPDAQVLQFKGPTGYWVRIRVPEDDKEKTRQVYAKTKVDEGGVYMVRLD